jgi:tRNA threonylcarbamoyladenosine biosynthesis protein TsaB
MPLLQGLLADSGRSLSEVDRFAVTVGPGTFTGVRVGVSAIRGLALATGRPAVGVTTFAAMAETARMTGLDDWPLLVALDARRGEIYAQAFTANGVELGPPLVAPVASVIAELPGNVASVIGSAAELCARHAHAAGRNLACLGRDAAPRPVAVARLAVKADANTRPTPLYLRPPDARPQGGAAILRQ